MRRSAPLGPGIVIAKRFRLERLRSASTMARLAAFAATDLTTGALVSIEVTTTVVGPDYTVRSTRWPSSPWLVHLAAAGRCEETSVGYAVCEMSAGERLDDRIDRLVEDRCPRQLTNDRGSAQLVEEARRDAARLALPDADTVARGALGAVAALHAAGVVDGDLRPRRFVVEDGWSTRLVPDVDLEAYGGFTGVADNPTLNPAYWLAPEHLGEGGSSVRGDIYMLGMLVYLLLAGRPPFTPPRTLRQLVLAVANGTLPPVTRLRDWRGDVPQHVDAAVVRALERRPDERFADVAAFARALGVWS